MKILVIRNKWEYKDKEIPAYSGSIIRTLREKGHEVVDNPKNPDIDYKGIDFLLDLDCGRDDKGQLIWQCQDKRAPIPSGVLLIDNHGYPSLHRRISQNYDHVWFAVWAKRDLFVNHPSAHWCPNFTDLKWFNGAKYVDKLENEEFNFGFFGSKHGLSRADPMIEICQKHGWSYDVREIKRQYKHRWPHTAVAMSNCQNLFNHSQKHDGPNLRVMESMAMGKPLICDTDIQSGLTLLFHPWEHFVPYGYNYSDLEDAMKWAIYNPGAAAAIAAKAYKEIKNKHLVENRVDFILETIQ